jgi:hypothetical protein
MDGYMYRDQLIRVITTQTPGTQFWVAKADVRYNDKRNCNFFLWRDRVINSPPKRRLG